MIIIFTVSEVADICNVSSQAINKRIRGFSETERNKYLEFSETKKKKISEDGLLFFKSIYGIENNTYNAENKSDNVTLLLMEQLRVKDEQIKTLMEQNSHLQILLKSEQEKLLPPPKKSFFRRFWKN